MRDCSVKFTWSFDDFSYNYVTTVLGIDKNAKLDAINASDLRRILEVPDDNTEQ